MNEGKNRYAQIIEAIFFAYYEEGFSEVEFQREDIVEHAARLGIRVPKNVGDVIYSFRYRVNLPSRIRDCAPKGKQWAIVSAGRSRYKFIAHEVVEFIPNAALAETVVPDATPGLIALYALGDEQALLAKLRYNRLIDTFTRTTCYSLQNHLRTTVPGLGQVETDEIYVAVDKRGCQYVIPVQAKGGRDKLSVVQVEQDMALCAARFPRLICRPIGAQFMSDEIIALFEFEATPKGTRISSEKHYRLVPSADFDPRVLVQYGVVDAES